MRTLEFSKKLYHFSYLKSLDVWTGDVFFWLMPFSIYGIAWSEKRDEMRQASINRWEIGFIPFLRTHVSA
jgi:hypothetical protein